MEKSGPTKTDTNVSCNYENIFNNHKQNTYLLHHNSKNGTININEDNSFCITVTQKPQLLGYGHLLHGPNHTVLMDAINIAQDPVSGQSQLIELDDWLEGPPCCLNLNSLQIEKNVQF